MKKILMYLLCALMLLGNFTMPVRAGVNDDYYYAGEYAKKIKGTTYYISMNAYTSTEGDEVGCFYIFKGKKNLDKFKYKKNGEFVRIGANKYRYTGKNGSLTFTVHKNSMTVKQKGSVIKGINLSSKFKKTQTYSMP